MNKCEICEEEKYTLSQTKSVYLCPNCKEEYRRGLITDWHLTSLKNGEWIPQKLKSGREGVNNE